jgi:hypothetical protein
VASASHDLDDLEQHPLPRAVEHHRPASADRLERKPDLKTAIVSFDTLEQRTDGLPVLCPECAEREFGNSP